MHSEFTELARALRERRLASKSKGHILKHSQIQPANRMRTLGGHAPSSPWLTPIRGDADEIIGVKVHCTCGQEIHVYFEYPTEEPPPAA